MTNIVRQGKEVWGRIRPWISWTQNELETKAMNYGLWIEGQYKVLFYILLTLNVIDLVTDFSWHDLFTGTIAFVLYGSMIWFIGRRAEAFEGAAFNHALTFAKVHEYQGMLANASTRIVNLEKELKDARTEIGKLRGPGDYEC